MKVLVVGSGGREHALAWKLARSPKLTSLHAVPGSAAMAALAKCHPGTKAADIDGVVALAQRESIDLVVVGPEDPLAAGIADRLRDIGIATFGPSAAAAQLEGSKAFAKDFMQPSRNSDRALCRIRRKCTRARICRCACESLCRQGRWAGRGQGCGDV